MDKPASRSAPNAASRVRSVPSQSVALISLMVGLWLAISLLKFGNPFILDHLIVRPNGPAELIFQPWPFAWGCVLAVVVFIVAFLSGPRRSVPGRKWLFWLPLAWFGWQLVSGIFSVDTRLSNPALVHFAITIGAFYLGYLILSGIPVSNLFWVPILLAFGWALFAGMDQHYGGLEASRKAFYEQPNWQLYPKEYIDRMATGRIFSTFVYPNAFAGAILLLVPTLIYKLLQMSQQWPRVMRGVVIGIFGYISLACLYWTGSKGGWLIAILLTGIALLHMPGHKRMKMAVVAAVLCVGLAAFFIKFRSYFEKGAPSVGARFTYWSAAWKTAVANPLFGTGPATFAVPYRQIKPADAEMARLAHNDYLEQASDSGWIGFALYTTFIIGSFLKLYRQRLSKPPLFWVILLGLAAWSLQGLMEFGLYIPALAWPAFLFFGWLLGEIDQETQIASQR